MSKDYIVTLIPNILDYCIESCIRNLLWESGYVTPLDF